MRIFLYFRHLIFWPIAVLSIFSPVVVGAEPLQSGLSATIYNNWTPWNQYNDSPPIPPTTPICDTLIYQNLEAYFDQEPVCQLFDDFVVKFEGYITAPETKTYTFYMHGDDGTKLYFDDEIVSDYWYDTGDGGNVFNYSMTAGQSVELLAWFYENGGGAWVRLEYLNSDSEWEVVPSSWFTQQPSTVPTTTTTTTTTTVPETTTTTIQETTTTWPLTTTTVSIPPATVTTTTPKEEPTPLSTTTVPQTSTIPTSTTSLPPSTTTIVSTTTIPITPEITREEAVSLATNADVVKSLNADEASAVFSAIEVDELTEEQAEQLVAAVQNAPEEVKKAFEEEINVFGGAVDTYVPVGSSVPIGTRRVIIGVSAVVIFSAPPSSRRT